MIIDSKHVNKLSFGIQFPYNFISENTGKFLLRYLAALTNSIYCTSQRGTLINRRPVMMTPIGCREFPTIF